MLILTATAFLLTVFAIAAGMFAGAEFALPIALLAALVLGFLALNTLLARRAIQRHHGDAAAAQEDAGDGWPAAHLIPDDRPLGDTAQAHDEISPTCPRTRRGAAPPRRRQRGATARPAGMSRGRPGGAVLAPVHEDDTTDNED